jgi:hypothetical protein
VGPQGVGTFCDEPRPLIRIYLPEQREGSRIAIEPLSPSEAFIELLRHGFATHVADAMGLRRQRFETFSRIVRDIPVRRLRYPPGFEHLERVGEAIDEDVNGERWPAAACGGRE